MLRGVISYKIQLSDVCSVEVTRLKFQQQLFLNVNGIKPRNTLYYMIKFLLILNCNVLIIT